MVIFHDVIFITSLIGFAMNRSQLSVSLTFFELKSAEVLVASLGIPRFCSYFQ